MNKEYSQLKKSKVFKKLMYMYMLQVRQSYGTSVIIKQFIDSDNLWVAVTIQLPQRANYTYYNQPPSPQAHALTHFLIINKNIYR